MASAGKVPGRIFISYRRDETAWAAGRLFDRLADHFGEDQVFTDVDSIKPGDDFAEMITAAVGSCDGLLALIGDRWLTITGQDGRRRLDDPRDFVRLEIEAALERDIRVIPILVEGARMPYADELPASLAKLARRQALELSPARFGRDTERLLRVLDQTINQAQERTRRKAEHAARRWRIEQLQQKIREQAAARDWDAVVAASDELAGLDLATTDPDGLASTARKQIADRQQAEEAERAAARAQHLADDPFARPDELPLASAGVWEMTPAWLPSSPDRVGHRATSKKMPRGLRLRRGGLSIRRRPAMFVTVIGIASLVTAASLAIASSVFSATPPGTVRWFYTIGGSADSGPTVVGGTAYVGSDDDKVYALDTATGHFRWSYTTGGYVESSPSVVGGTVYVGSEDDKVYALDAATGHFRWSYTTGSSVESSPAVVGGTVYVGSWDYKVYALDAATGHFRWSYTTGGVANSSPVVVDGTVYVGSDDKKVYALDAATGRFRWSYTTGSSVESDPVVVGGTVYVGSDDKKVYALDAATGRFRWSHTTGSGGLAGLAVVGGTVYVGSWDDKVYALDAATGRFRWSYTTGDGVTSVPAVADGTVYIGSLDDKVYALDAATGRFRWSYTTGAPVSSAPAVVGGTVYVGSWDGKVYALNASS